MVRRRKDNTIEPHVRLGSKARVCEASGDRADIEAEPGQQWPEEGL
jgi:hypothetical protein